MDADKVKRVEFSRRLRGYDVGQVDAFLDEVEVSLRRGRLEQENLQHKLEELSGARDAQSEMLSVLNGQILLAQEESQRLTERVAQLEKELEEKNARIAELEEQNTRAGQREKSAQPAKPEGEMLPSPELPPWEEPVDKKAISLEQLQKHLRDVGTAAKDSFLQASQTLKNRKKK